MNKVALKQEKAAETDTLFFDPSLIDTHRTQPKAKGGIYTKENTNIISPREHMRLHGNLRERTEQFEHLKALVDDRKQVMKLKNKANNQLLAYQRKTDHLTEETVAWLKAQVKQLSQDLSKRSRAVEKAVKEYAKYDELAKASLGVPGIGANTVAMCLNYIDLNKARHPSSLWSYAGLDKPSHARYEKGEAGGGNKTLRTALYVMADSNIKTRGAYREVYDNVKSRLEVSQKMTKSRNTQGKLVECKWSETKPCHRHGAAIRAVMQHFLADYWYVGRTLMGLETNPTYAEAQLGMSHKTINPAERGWAF